MSTIINNKFEKTIQIIRIQGTQFDPVYPRSFMKNAGLCQNIVIDVNFIQNLNFLINLLKDL